MRAEEREKMKKALSNLIQSIIEADKVDDECFVDGILQKLKTWLNERGY